MSAIVPHLLSRVEDKADVSIDNPTKKQILEYINVGDRVSYIGKDKLYRSGGFVIKIDADGGGFVLMGGPYKWFVKQSSLATIFVVYKKQNGE
jgi:hypothetical protein